MTRVRKKKENSYNFRGGGTFHPNRFEGLLLLNDKHERKWHMQWNEIHINTVTSQEKKQHRFFYQHLKFILQQCGQALWHDFIAGTQRQTVLGVVPARLQPQQTANLQGRRVDDAGRDEVFRVGVDVGQHGETKLTQLWKGIEEKNFGSKLAKEWLDVITKFFSSKIGQKNGWTW